ncbi:MAG TPA: GTP-binding protein, partial [Actinomycetota bacterium]|nr:GTP-binding protein [Actinomycetota bacterium]
MHVIATAGHVDHGKSTLVQALTGIDPDRLEEEKRRGLTIDLGFAWLELPSGREVGIVDVPGHERFIKNMLAGVGAINVTLFVVAANEGWKPQSQEHLDILDLLGVSSAVVAVTKADLVDASSLAAVMEDVAERIASTTLRGSPVLAVSSVTGAGLEELRAELERVMDATPPAEDRDRPRLWVDRVFSMRGSGTVVTGTLTGGGLRQDQEIEVLPEGL